VTRATALALARAARPFALVIAWHLAIRAAFAWASAREGLVTPEGAPHLGVIALGVAALVSRLFVVGALPAIVAYRVAIAAWARRRGAPKP
jgi:hypothetical protein